MTAVDMTRAALAVVLGGGLAAGVCLMLSALPRWSAPSLSRRIAGYIRDIADPAGLTPLSGVGPPAGDLLRRLLSRVGGADSAARRLRQAGRAATADAVVAFRARQLAWAVAGLVAGGLLAVALVVVGRFTPAGGLVPLVAAAAGAAACDMSLTRAARRRVRRIREELPTFLEFLALCLSAGEGILDALRRVGGVGAGALSAEVRAAMLAVGTGSPLAEALTAMATGLQTPTLTRCVDHVVAALERGAPLAAVLQAQAQDAREDAKRVLIETAGQKEILMLLPLVFLILPLSVLFAVFPGVFMLRLGLG